jgi:hypothetical protein
LGLICRKKIATCLTKQRGKKVATTITKQELLPADITIVADDFPIEQNILHLRALANVVDDEVTSGLWRNLIHHDSDVRNSSTQIPSDKIARMIIAGVSRQRQSVTMAAEKNHEIWNATMIDIRVGGRRAC